MSIDALLQGTASSRALLCIAILPTLNVHLVRLLLQWQGVARRSPPRRRGWGLNFAAKTICIDVHIAQGAPESDLSRRRNRIRNPIRETGSRICSISPS
ncbi:hypothetical protein BD311DRAFT_260781 [Dichomitus squalens]|uniref:Uncharacterized protein n=1 Tax=Dichomitus squalens TaxID=114155 RepID=A0A4V2K0P4_9APHY|nr:hypothetical protein BD311DRAFT_260781 [Dichomitus squalens]